MINLNSTTLICMPINQVFDFVSRHENDLQWQYGTLATASLSDGFSDMGTLFRSIGHLMGRRNLSTFEVTEYELYRLYGFKSRSGPFELQTRHVFEMKDRCTQIDISTQIKIVDFFRVDEGVLEISLKKQLKENLTRLKDVLEVKNVQFVN